jgi:hypothetical protein
MKIVRMVQAWRERQLPTFGATREPASIEARLGAAEYEMQQITRDVYAVLLNETRTGHRNTRSAP